MTQINTDNADPTEKALLSEFGTYLSAVTKGFAEPVEATIQNAERQVRQRLSEYEQTLNQHHLDSQKKIAEAEKQLSQRLSAYQKAMDDAHTEASERIALQHASIEALLEEISSYLNEAKKGLLGCQQSFEVETKQQRQILSDFVTQSKSNLLDSQQQFQNSISSFLQEGLRAELKDLHSAVNLARSEADSVRSDMGQAIVDSSKLLTDQIALVRKAVYFSIAVGAFTIIVVALLHFASHV
ncbi:MAG: hypothetical protein CXZ00_15685 [Acidobacteria bacterium]|nr:MAG: hypothetical protein CXZ00_15685 [Acidobacteriota bacterium]